MLPARGDGIIPEYDYEEDVTQDTESERHHQEIEDIFPPSSSELAEGSLRLVGGHVISEVMEITDNVIFIHIIFDLLFDILIPGQLGGVARG